MITINKRVNNNVFYQTLRILKKKCQLQLQAKEEVLIKTLLRSTMIVERVNNFALIRIVDYEVSKLYLKKQNKILKF